MEETVKSHCNSCRRITSHEVVVRKDFPWSDDTERQNISGSVGCEIVRRCGCDAVGFRQLSRCSLDIDVNGEEIVCVSVYPPTTTRQQPKWIFEYLILGEQTEFLSELLDEIYVALGNRVKRLAAMGIRALIEHVMVHKVGDQGSFQKNLQAFESKGYVSSTQRKVVESVIEAGHAAMHRGHNPSESELEHLMDIVENIIESIYVNEHKAANVAKKTPVRKPHAP